MRLLISLLILCESVFASSLRYFFGMGINFASPVLEISSRSLNRSQKNFSMNSRSYVASFSGGVPQYWDRDKYVGGRAMGEFGIGGASVENGMAGVFSLSGALDLLVDFLKQPSVDLGVFGGFEYGMTFLASNARVNDYALKSETYSAYWRLGLSATFERFHRIDLTYKAPISPLALPTEVRGQETRHQTYSGAQFCLGYKLLF